MKTLSNQNDLLTPVPSKIKIWILAIRPKTLPAAIGPVLVGASFSHYFDKFKVGISIACILGALLLQIAANLANDYFDFKKGIDTEERLGPARVTAQGLLRQNQILIGLIITIIASIVVGLYLILVAGPLILIIGLLSIIALITYSGSIIAFGYRGLGDIFVFIFFGLIAVNGTYFANSESFQISVIFGSISSGLLINNILVVNNYRDRETDLKTGKRTLAVIIGYDKTRLQYKISLIMSYCMLIIIYFVEIRTIWIFLPIITIPFGWRLAGDLVQSNIGKNLNLTLAKTAKLSLQFQILLTIAILLA